MITLPVLEIGIDCLDSHLLSQILEFLDIATLGVAEAVSRRFRESAYHAWKHQAHAPLQFLEEDFLQTTSNHKTIVQRWIRARKYCDKAASTVRDHFFDRGYDAVGEASWSRLPQLQTSVLLSRFVSKYDFYFRITKVQRHSLLRTTANTTDRVHPATLDSDQKVITEVFDGFLTGLPQEIEGSKYVRLCFDVQELFTSELEEKWPELSNYLKNTQHGQHEEKTLTAIFHRSFAMGKDMPEITICAVGRNGKQKLIFATSGVERKGDADVVLIDRISEQHPMLTHQFGVVPRFSLTLKKQLGKAALDCFELQFQIAPR